MAPPIESCALVPPPRLHARKRQAPSPSAVTHDASDSDDSYVRTPFFTEAAYVRFSAFGGDSFAARHGDAELQRATCLSATTAARSSSKSSAFAVHRSVPSLATSLPPLPVTAVTIPAIHAPRQHLLQIIEARSTRGGERIMNAARRLSALTILEHEEYMHLTHRCINAQRSGVPLILALPVAEVDRWKALHERVRSEQTALSHDLAAVTQRELGPAMCAVPPCVESWYERMLLQCRNDVFQMYPQHYEPVVRLERSAADTAGAERYTMKHVKEVYCHGAYPVVHAERLAPGLTLDCDAMQCAAADARSAISADVHAEKLMDKFDCDVAMASSTLVALFDTDQSDLSGKLREWVIPMKSRVVMTRRGAAKKHVYLDKPLPGAAVSAREKIAAAGRANVLAALQTLPPDGSEPPAKGRTTYHVWELSGLRVLVRCTTYAALLAPTTRSKSNTSSADATATATATAACKPQPLSVFVKPDYRSFGLDEQLTRSERLRFWIHSWLRGGSALAVARLHPQTLTVSAWETHSLASLVYGRDVNDAPEWFEPMESFEAVSQVLVAVCNVPAGTYLVKSPAPSRNGAIEILMATSSPASANTTAVSMDRASDGTISNDNSSSERFDLFDFVSQPRDSSTVVDYVLPKWPTVRGRAPYCFRTGTYCVDFLVDGNCPAVQTGVHCDGLHIRRARPKGSASAADGTAWVFEDFSSAVKAAAKARVVAGKMRASSRRLWPDFSFCRDTTSDNPMNVFAPMRCAKPSGTCALPHRTLHEIAELVADATLHKRRDSVRTYKSNKKQRTQDQRVQTVREVREGQ